MNDTWTMDIEVWPIAMIIPYEQNPRTHPAAQVTLLASLMRKRGIDQPIVVDEKGLILKGHGRLLAAHEAGLTKFPVVVRRDMTEADKRAMRIEDNQLALLSGWDETLLRNEVAELKLNGYDLAALGFSETELEKWVTEISAPLEFKTLGEDIETEHQCPKCGYRWSGNYSGVVPKEK